MSILNGVNPSLLTNGHDEDFYDVVDGVLVPKSAGEVAAITAARQAQSDAAQARLDAIKAKQDAAGLKEITMEAAETYIENMFDTAALDATGPAIQNATDLDELKTALYATLLQLRALIIKTKEVHLKEIPYLLD